MIITPAAVVQYSTVQHSTVVVTKSVNVNLLVILYRGIWMAITVSTRLIPDPAYYAVRKRM